MKNFVIKYPIPPPVNSAVFIKSIQKPNTGLLNNFTESEKYSMYPFEYSNN